MNNLQQDLSRITEISRILTKFSIAKTGLYETYFNLKAKRKVLLKNFLNGGTTYTIDSLPEWVFQEYHKDGIKKTPLVNPDLKPSLQSFMQEKTLLEIQDDLREYITYHGKDNFVSVVKSLLPAVTVSAFYTNRRQLKESYVPTNLLCFDFDGQDPEHAKQTAKSLGICSYIATSITGTGIFAIVPVQDDKKLSWHYQAVKERFESVGLKVDELRDRTRLRGWSHDPEAIIDESVPVFTEIKEPVKACKKVYEIGESKGPTEKYDKELYCEYVWTYAKGDEKIKDCTLHEFAKTIGAIFRNHGINYEYACEYLYKKIKDCQWFKREKRYSKDRLKSDLEGIYNSYPEQFNTKNFPLYLTEEQKAQGYSIGIMKTKYDDIVVNVLNKDGYPATWDE